MNDSKGTTLMADDDNVSLVMPREYAVGEAGPSFSDAKKQTVGERVTTGTIWVDKQAFTRLLNIWRADAADQHKTIDLGINQELSRMIPLFCSCFTREELVELVGEETTAAFFTLYRTEMLQNLVLEHELRNLLRAFNEAGIPLLLFKGPVLAYSVYAEPHLRTYHDLDALVHPTDIPRVQELLTGMGYRSYEEYRANAIEKKRTGYNFMLERAEDWMKTPLELHTAPHAGDISSDFDVAALWDNAQEVEIAGEQALAMHPRDHLLYLCYHVRFHWFSRLLWLYDLVILLRAMGSETDWAALVQAARRQRLATTLYYCLLWCRDLFGVTVPDNVLARLQPPLLSRWYIERLAMPEPARALVSSAWETRRILAHRAMVDSAGELLKVGLQTFFPAPVELGRRYMDRSRLPLKLLFLYYLVHPWITLAKGLRYLFRRRRSK